MSPRGWVLFAAMSVIWGTPYFFIKVAIDDGVSPVFIAWARIVLAVLILVPLAWRAGLLGSLRGRGRWLVAYALAEMVIPFPLISAGEKHVDSSLAAIIIAAVPLLIALLAIRFDHEERVTGSRLVGLFVGLGGVVALLGIDVAGEPDELLGAAAILVAALGYAIGPLVLKRGLADLDPRATMGMGLVIAAIVLTPFAAVGAPSSAPSTEAILSILALGAICTAIAFVLFAHLITEVGASRALVFTYVNPVVALALGIAILGERPGLGAVVGLVLILAGSWLSTRGGRPEPDRPQPRRSSPPEPDPSPIAR
jgi:drug/metabolite transporter (DMT)-like permease